MAKKDKAAKAGKTITVKEVATEYGVNQRALRMLMRKSGLKAPKADTPKGVFGPKSKYIFEVGSADHKKVVELAQKLKENPPKKREPKEEKTEKGEKGKKGKKKAKKEEEDEDEDEEEEEEDGDEDEDEEEEDEDDDEDDEEEDEDEE